MKKSIALLLTVFLIMGAFSVVTLADDFVPSVTVKDEPVIVPPESVVNPGVVAIIQTDAGTSGEYTEVKDSNIVVTALKDVVVPGASLTAEGEKLLVAYEQMANKVASGSPVERVLGIPDARIQAEGLPYDNVKMTVSSMIDISINTASADHGELTGELAHPDKHIVITFAMTRPENGAIIVCHMNMANGQWITVSKEDTVWNAEGTALTVDFDSLCPIVFLNVIEDEEETQPVDPFNPWESGDTDPEDTTEERETSDVTDSEEDVTTDETENTTDETELPTEDDTDDATETDTTESESGTEPADEEDGGAVVWIIIAVAAVVIAGGVVAFIVIKKKK